MIFESEYKVGIRDIGKENKATNKAILKYFESVACQHSDQVGFGINNIKTSNVVWILLDWKFKLLERPTYGQTLKVRTWSRKLEKCHAYRDFEAYDENGKLLAIATSKWVLLEADTRRIQKVTDEIGGKYETESEKHVFDEELEKMHVPENEQASLKLKVRRTDIDINEHVNNLNYLDLAYEVLPLDVYNKDFKNIRITYRHQTKPGETVNISYSHEQDKEIVTITTENKEELHAIIELW